MQDNAAGGFRNRDFFRLARKILESEGHEDAAYYFEQMEEYVADGSQLPTDYQGVTRALGI